VLVVLLLAVPAASPAQEGSRRVSGLLGFGGAPNGSPEDGLDHFSFQLGFAFELEGDLMVSARLGQMSFDGDPLGQRIDPTLTWVNAAGEYLFDEGYYTSGVYFGLGWYGLGNGGSGLGSDDAAGAVLGLTGDFAVQPRFSVLVDLSAHYTGLDDIDLLLMGHVGVAYHW
jgi:hypothetical protein